MPRFVKILLLAVLVFGLGVGLALWQKNNALAPQSATETAETLAAPQTAPAGQASTPAPATTAETPAAAEILPGAPEMPVAASNTEEPAAAPPPPRADEVISLPPEGASAESHEDHMEAMDQHDHEQMPAPEDATPVAGSQAGGPFSLTDQNGNAVTEKSWPGKYKLVFFGFTHCPDICPVTLDKLTTLLNGDAALAAKVQPLFITTDPARDTPEVLKAYLANYNPSILGLTGTEEQLKEAESGYKVYVSKGEEHEGNYLVDHSSYIYLLSPDDKALEILSAQLSGEDLAAKIKPHLAETPAQ